MASAIFSYNGIETTISCRKEETMEEICQKFTLKIGKNKENLFFLYNGKNLNNKNTFQEQINNIDKNNNIIKILVNDIMENKNNINDNIINSKEIICPKCNDISLIYIKDYKIDLKDRKNNHDINNILFHNFEGTQKTDLSK